MLESQYVDRIIIKLKCKQIEYGQTLITAAYFFGNRFVTNCPNFEEKRVGTTDLDYEDL